MPKNQKGFSMFTLSEEKKKAESKKTPAKGKTLTGKKSKPSSRKESDGADDAEYVRLMDEYKRSRHGGRSSQKILNKALNLSMEGDVSQEAITAGHHI
jgi:hypothetical protein